MKSSVSELVVWTHHVTSHEQHILTHLKTAWPLGMKPYADRPSIVYSMQNPIKLIIFIHSKNTCATKFLLSCHGNMAVMCLFHGFQQRHRFVFVYVFSLGAIPNRLSSVTHRSIFYVIALLGLLLVIHLTAYRIEEFIARKNYANQMILISKYIVIFEYCIHDKIHTYKMYGSKNVLASFNCIPDHRLLKIETRYNSRYTV